MRSSKMDGILNKIVLTWFDMVYDEDTVNAVTTDNHRPRSFDGQRSSGPNGSSAAPNNQALTQEYRLLGMPGSALENVMPCTE